MNIREAASKILDLTSIGNESGNDIREGIDIRIGTNDELIGEVILILKQVDNADLIALLKPQANGTVDCSVIEAAILASQAGESYVIGDAGPFMPIGYTKIFTTNEVSP